jgi:phosphoglycolate phosphatase
VGHVRRLIVFDLDGTLIDSRRDLADAANALILERGGQPQPEEAVGRMVGEGAAMLVRRALTAAGLPVDASALPRFLELYDDRLLKTTVAYDGIPEALERLAREATLAVLTNKPLGPSRRILEALQLAPHLAETIGGDSAFPRKPDPTSLRHLMTACDAPSSATVLVGDSWVDYETARAAGVGICLVRYGFGFQSVDPSRLGGDEALVDRAADIPGAVQGLLESRRQRA